FGCRQLTEALVALAPGLALLLEWARNNGYRLLVAVGCLLVLWNLLLIRQYQVHLVPPDAGAAPTLLFGNLLRLIHARPPVLLVRIAGTVAMTILLCYNDAKSQFLSLGATRSRS